MVKEASRCYAVRRLNPFRGVAQIAETSNGRAISLDGCHWEIQIEAPRPDDLWGSQPAGEPVTQFLRFGIWSDADGMRRIPAHPLLDLSAMLEAAEILVDLLQRQQQNIPFPLQDKFELWLLDGRDRMPLALLASSPCADTLQPPSPLRWRCCELGATDFASPGTDRSRPRHPRDTDPHPHMHALERMLLIESGHSLAQCFERYQDGTASGRPIAGFERLTDRRLPASAFPELLLRQSWQDDHDSELVSDYLSWLAPRLLTLQQISDGTRSRLEKQARGQALLVAETWSLYPKIIDRGSIDSARVEAEIRRSHGE